MALRKRLDIEVGREVGLEDRVGRPVLPSWASFDSVEIDGAADEGRLRRERKLRRIVYRMDLQPDIYEEIDGAKTRKLRPSIASVRLILCTMGFIAN
jgi:hypothetical protein